MNVRAAVFRVFAFTAAMFALVVRPALVGAAVAEPLPGPTNIILILGNDIGYGDLGCYGGRAKTPNIDRLAREGIRFTDYHSNGTTCVPTRVSLLTGRYFQRLGDLGGAGEGSSGLPKQEKTIAEYLKERNYATGLLGTWNLGYEPRNGPLHQGFDHFRGPLHGAVDYFSKVDKFGRMDWWHNDRVVADETYVTDLITNDTIEFVTANRARPFFAFVSHIAIHFPWLAPGDQAHRKAGVLYDDLDGPQSKLGPHRGDLGAVVVQMIESLDAGVGRIMETLRELGIDRQTLVLFTSDNGGEVSYRGGYSNISSNGPLRDGKGSIYEGGHRVPFIAWWPGRIEPGSISNATALSMDVLPTLLAVTGAKLPPSAARQMDGIDLSRLLFEQTAPAARDLFWGEAGNAKAVRRGPWKLVQHPSGQTELYDLGSDIGEKWDLSSIAPKRVAELRAALEDWPK